MALSANDDEKISLEYTRGLLVKEIEERERGREREREREERSSGATLERSDPPHSPLHAHFTINTFKL